MITIGASSILYLGETLEGNIDRDEIAKSLPVVAAAGQPYRLVLGNGRSRSKRAWQVCRPVYEICHVRFPLMELLAISLSCKNPQQVIGYLRLSGEATSHSTKHDKAVQVAGYPANGREGQGSRFASFRLKMTVIDTRSNAGNISAV